MSDPLAPAASLLIQSTAEHEDELLRRLGVARALRAGSVSQPRSLGARIADRVAATVGSWPFIIVQSALLICWIALNLTAFARHWDPYPFILLNLALSFQAAYAAPFIMMSQNRQAAIDRAAAEQAYDVDVEAELEIELLHTKIDRMRGEELAEILRVVNALHQMRVEPQNPP